MLYNSKAIWTQGQIWLVGQAAKTRPSQGWNGSSILPRVTKNNLNRFIRFRLFLFKTEGLVYGINSLRELYGIATLGVWHQPSGCIPSTSVLIPYNAIGIDSILAKARFHTATSCGFHTTQCVDFIHGYAVILYERTKRITIAKRNLLFYIAKRRRLVSSGAHASVPKAIFERKDFLLKVLCIFPKVV